MAKKLIFRFIDYMRVSGINFYNFSSNKKVPNFGAGIFAISENKKPTKKEIKKRINELEKQGIVSPYADILAELNKSRYQKAINLAQKGVEPSCIEEITCLEGEKYAQANQLIQKGILDSFLFQIANMDEIQFKKAMSYLNMGFDADCLKLFAQLSEKQTQIAKNLLIDEKLTPFSAGNFAGLNNEQRKVAIGLLEFCEANTAAKIAKLDKIAQEKCINYIKCGINPLFVIEIAQLTPDEEERLDEILNLKVGDINIADFAKMTEEQYARTKELYTQGVNPDYILDILLIEEGKADNENYRTYRERGYSYTTSASLSCLSDTQIDALEELIKIHPQIRELFKEEYKVEIIQLQNNEEIEAILTNRFRTENGTIIELVQTFDSYGDSTKSRLEKYTDDTTSSMMSNKSGVFKAKYDKNGEIKELTELIQDPQTKEVIGLIHSIASDLLNGVFESIYYSLNDIKEGGNVTPDMDITECITRKGEPISKVVKNSDGSITYIEDFQMNQFGIDRTYNEKKDETGNIVYSSYSYTITDTEDETILMDISRSFEKQNNNTAINRINGIEYKLEYNDTKKTITINDGIKTKVLDFASKLPSFSDDILWETIKKLPVDTLLKIDRNIDKWHFCEAEDSILQARIKTLSTSNHPNIIDHEVGHLNSFEDDSIYFNDDLIQTYGREMDVFKENMPYNEQLFVQYFSPRAELMQADGYDEFVAETNIILNTYGIDYKKFKTRSQFLAKYFPETIAKIAQLTGKTSRESLL